MDAVTKQELQRAYAYLKSGDRKSASQIVVAVLKRDSEVEQAWLILSLAVDEPQRQVYALQQVLRINSDNDKARERLTKLGGSAPSAPPPTRAAAPAPMPEPSYEDEEPFEAAGEGDLLTSRLFGDDAPAETGEVTGTASMGGFRDDVDDAEEEPPFEYEEPGTAPAAARPRRERKPGAGRRLLVVFVLLLLLFVLLGGGYWAVTNGLIGGAPRAGADQSATPEASATTTATEEVFALPATWTPTVFVPPAATPTNTPLPTSTPTQLANQMSGEAASEADTVEDQVATVRGLPLDLELGRALVSQSVIEEVLRNETLRDGFMQRSGDISVVYGAFGLGISGANMQTYYQNTQIQPWGGLYLADSQTIYLLGINFEARQAYGYAHLFDLALIDAEFGLESLGLAPDCVWGMDQCSALNALVQGDAMLTRHQWATRYLPQVQAGDVRTMDDVVRFYSDINPMLFHEADLQFPYVQGLAFVEALYDEGGWDAVNEAYLNPPVTTEQILHPELYLAGETPIEVSDPLAGEGLPAGWRLLDQGTLGEWRTFLFLRYNMLGEFPIEEEDAAAAAAGWGGDQYQVYLHDQSGRTALMAHWIFDTAEDAEEFDAALALYLSGRFPGEADSSIPAACYGSGPVGCTLLIDNEVFWLAAPDAETMEILLDGLGLGG